MPVSKKRKKEGKPVRRSSPADAVEGAEGAETPEKKSGHPQQRSGKPSNPFVAQQPKARSSQRGR
jgi:hypothetical protein